MYGESGYADSCIQALMSSYMCLWITRSGNKVMRLVSKKKFYFIYSSTTIFRVLVRKP